LNTTYMY